MKQCRYEACVAHALEVAGQDRRIVMSDGPPVVLDQRIQPQQCARQGNLGASREHEVPMCPAGLGSSRESDHPLAERILY